MKKIKLLTSMFAVTGLTTSFIPLVSCNANKDTTDYPTVVQNLKLTALEEFIALSEIPRPSFECGKIYLYLKNRIQQLGFSAFDVGAGSDQPGKGQEGKKVLGQYNNIYFDIPATTGCDSYEPVILQAHMDMVRTGQGAEPGSTKYLEEGVKPVLTMVGEEPVLQSYNQLTSLGSDNGMGVATCLALAIHKDELKHGRIRVLFTYDEEVGLYGAEDIKAHSPHFFDGYKYVINIDSEEDCAIVYQSYGIAKTDFWVSSEAKAIGSTDNVVEIKLHGLHGGHSGADIGNGFANAERLVYEILSSLNTSESVVKLIQCDHQTSSGKETSPAHNSLISDFNLWIETNLTTDSINNKFSELRDSAEATGWKNKYKGEDWANVSFSAVKDTTLEVSTVCLSEEVSEEYVNLMGNKFLCGVYDMRDESRNIPGSSGNVGPTAFTVKNQKMVVNSSHAIRTDKDEIIKWVTATSTAGVPAEWLKYNHNLLIFEKLTPEQTEVTSQLPILGWHSKTIEEGNTLWSLLATGYKEKAGKDSVAIPALGSLECTTFFETNKDLNIISTGSTIRYPHDTKETFYINSYVNMLNSLLYTLVHAHELN